MKDVLVVDKLVVDINDTENVGLVPIWDDNITVIANADNVVFENIRYVLCLRQKNNQVTADYKVCCYFYD